MKHYLIFILLLIFIRNSYCQENHQQKLINYLSAGVLSEIGISYYEIDSGDRYTPIILGGVLELPLYKTKNFFNVSLSFFPNVAVVLHPKSQTSYEFGFNVRVNLNFAVSPYDVIRGSIGSGPHYIDYQCCRQADGFLFSDYFLASYIRYFKLNKIYCSLVIELGYRHISNAGIEKPNGGISNFIVGLGFNVLINSRGLSKESQIE
jgi:hypothetical protein